MLRATRACWTSDPQGAADLRPCWGWRPFQYRNGCFTNLSVQRCKCLLCFLRQDITATTSSEKLCFEKRFFFWNFSSSPNFFGTPAPLISGLSGLYVILWDKFKIWKTGFMHAYPAAYAFLRVASVVAKHCVQILTFFCRGSRNNVAFN